MQRDGHDHAEPPREILIVARRRHEEEKDLRHEQSGDAAAEIAPSAGRRVRHTHDALGELLRAPYLAGDKGREAHANKESADNKSDRAGDEGEADDEWCRHQHYEGKAAACANLVADDAHKEAADNVGCDAHHVSYVEICSCEAERLRLLERLRQRGRRKGREEGGEEGEGGGVEGAHVRVGDAG